MIDNYDSFTYNLVQYLGELGAELRVYRNDKITVDEIRALKPSYIIISPGPICSATRKSRLGGKTIAASPMANRRSALRTLR